MTHQTAAFDFHPRTRIVFGDGALSRLGELATESGLNGVLLVTDRGVEAAGHSDRARDSLMRAGLAVTLFDQVRENPTTHDVEACLDVARKADIEAFIAVGGGSTLDTAKGCNFLLTNGGKMEDYRGEDKATRPMLPLIAVPTTAGTGSECQSAALIADERTHQKFACRDPKAAPIIALLDPRLTLTQPPRVTACTGIDALAHALETAVTTARHEMSLLFSHRAFFLASYGLPRVLEQPADLAARGQMLLAAALAGCAIECSMLGAAHAAANPLTAHHGIAHGQAVGMMLPAVVAFNCRDPQARRAYADLAVTAGLASTDDAPPAAAAALCDWLHELLGRAGMPASLSECGVRDADVGMLGIEAAGQWTAGFNPCRLTSADFEALYRQTMEPRPRTTPRPARQGSRI